jgi:uncharacterized protein YjbJ (UPF0337 family)
MSATIDKIKGNWNHLKGELTDDDLMYQEGKEDEMIGKLQEKL